LPSNAAKLIMKIGSPLKIFYRSFGLYWWIRKWLLSYALRLKNKGAIPLAIRPTPVIVNNIRQNGFSFLDTSGLPVEEIVSYCNSISYANDPWNECPDRLTPGKSFWRLLVDNSNIQAHQFLLDFAKNEYFHVIATNYLGINAVLSSVTLMKSYPNNEPFNHSQMWHLDADDSKNVVIYLYVSEVSSENGPFELVPLSSMKKVLPPRCMRKHVYSDFQIQKFVSRFSPISIVGPSGSMFACDTCTTYHRGSRCTSTIRLALSIRYQTPTGLYPFYPL